MIGDRKDWGDLPIARANLIGVQGSISRPRMVALGYIPRPSMSIGMCTESLGLGLHRDDSNRTLSQLFVCFVFFASCALFSLIVNLSNCSYTNPIHSFGAQGCDSCRTLAANPQTFFEFSSLPFLSSLSAPIILNCVPTVRPPTSLSQRHSLIAANGNQSSKDVRSAAVRPLVQ